MSSNTDQAAGAGQIRLDLPAGGEGAVWLYHGDSRRYPTHTHDELELNVVQRGRAVLILGEHRHELGRLSLVWIPSHVPHILLDATPELEMWIAVWSPPLVERVGPQALQGPRGLGEPHKKVAEAAASRLSGLCEEVASAEGQDPPRFNAGLAYLLRLAWAEHERAGEANLGEAVHPAVERAARVLAEDPSLDAAAVARAVRMSRARLSDLFHRQTGLTLRAYRTRRRMERFFAAFQGPVLMRPTLLEAALSAGFGSYAQFHRAFRQQTGQSPRQWLRQREGDATR